LGFFNADIAFLSSASISACFLFFALIDWSGWLASISFLPKLFDLERLALFDFGFSVSAEGILDSAGPSLSSLFMVAIDGIVADRISEIALLGPWELCRRCLSSLRISARLLDWFTGTGRFVAAPGLE
jgi:hypothetical protein